MAQCKDCIHNDICQFYKALCVNVICYPCGFYEAKSNEELFKQALVEGLNRRFDKTIEEAKRIEEIANDINMHCCSLAEQFCGETSCNACLTNFLYNVGYRKHNKGNWEKYGNKRTCSKCNFTYFTGDDGFKYCPECGVKVRYID